MGGCDGSALHGDVTWPTPEAGSFGGDQNIEKTLNRRAKYAEKYGNNGFGLTLAQAVAASRDQWLTPAGMAGMDHTGKAGAGGEFAQQATRWLTPNVPNGGRSVSEALVHSKGTTPEGEKKTVGLESQTRYWATPTASPNSNRGNKMAPSHGDGHGLVLAGQAGQWEPTAEPSSLPVSARPTPAARDAKGPNSEAHVTTNGTGRMHMDQLANFVAFSPLVQPIPDGQTSSPETQNSRRHLNPLFGAKLMGWPSTWTIAEPHASSALATALFRSQLQQQLSCFFGARGL